MKKLTEKQLHATVASLRETMAILSPVRLREGAAKQMPLANATKLVASSMSPQSVAVTPAFASQQNESINPELTRLMTITNHLRNVNEGLHPDWMDLPQNSMRPPGYKKYSDNDLPPIKPDEFSANDIPGEIPGHYDRAPVTAPVKKYSDNDLPPIKPDEFSAKDIPGEIPGHYDRAPVTAPVKSSNYNATHGGTDAKPYPGQTGVQVGQLNQPVQPITHPAKIAKVLTTAAKKPTRQPDPMVKAAQQGLIANGFLPTGSDDGLMGDKTIAAYAKFSEKYPTVVPPIREHVTFGHAPELVRILELSRR